MPWTVDSKNRLDIFYVTTYLPRQCGIATYCADLARAVATHQGNRPFRVVAMTDREASYDYPQEVEFEIFHHRHQDYYQAADYLNFSAADVISLQHEYNIFGGPAGASICRMLEAIDKPVVTTLHTVERHPDREHRDVLAQVASFSQALVVMNPIAVEILEEVYGVSPVKVSVIHHGVPDVPFVDPAYYKDQFGVAGKFVLLTFGLLHPGKGIEVAIQSLPKVVERHPQVVYIVLGATHPVIKRQQGEAYRLSLQDLAMRLGVADHVRFVDRFVSAQELYHFLQASDIYITPYLGKDQMTSGTLAYAVGMGKAVVSTPYWHAQSLLADGRGRLVDFGDAGSLADTLLDLIENEAERHAMRKRAYEYARNMVWREVGRRYLEVFRNAIREFRSQARPSRRPTSSLTLPEIRLDHLERLTDDTGILQHSIWGVPNRRHGYSTADAARALVVCVRHHRQYQDPKVAELARTYLAFLVAAQDEEGNLATHLSYDRRPLVQGDREKCRATCLWGLGSVISSDLPEGLRAVARELFDANIQRFSPHNLQARALGLLGMLEHLARYPGATDIRRRATELAESLCQAFEEASTDQWRWFSDRMESGFAKLPEATLKAALVLGNNRYGAVGLSSLDFLTQSLDQGEYFDLVGDQGWFSKNGTRAVFSQQPADAGWLVEAYLAAHRLTGNRQYAELARRAFWWFLGKNRLNIPVYDFATAACRDGLDPEGVNQNRGAEATIAFLLSALALLWDQVQTFPGEGRLKLRRQTASTASG